MRRAVPVDLGTHVGTVSLPNPILTASGTAGHGAELAAHMDLGALGAVVVKSVSAGPWAGNPAPRLHPVAGGMLNSVGLENRGIESWLIEDLPALAATGARVVASIWGFTVADFGRAASELAAAVNAAAARADGGRGAPAGAIVAVEANISCPNIDDSRHMFAHSETAAASVVAAAAAGLKTCGLPLWAKLSPNVTDLPAIAGAVLDAGAAALTLVNTLMGLALDPRTGRSMLGGGGGGVSGPALHPIAVRAVYECRRTHPHAPIVGVGGVTTGAEAAEFLAAGADAVGVGTATFADPRAPARIVEELASWCRNNDVGRVRDLVGRAHDHP